nr:hypothetical protein HAGR004_28300 [Bdellovibrio sp. HAGR004]
MKTLAFALTLFVASSSFAFPTCTQLEAQMMAQVASVEPVSETQCRVKLAWTGNWMFNPSYVCPLDIDEASSFGVITSCNYKVGAQIDGIVYRNVDGDPAHLSLY